MRWILDDGPFGHLAKTLEHAEELEHWQAGVLWVSGTTAAAATPVSQALLNRDVNGEPIVGTFEIRIGSNNPAEQVLNELHGDATSTTNLAEHESIAWSLVHGLDAVFVCADKRATLTALAELGHGRVAHPFDVWLDLLRREWLSRVDFEQLCLLTRKHDQGLPRMPRRVTESLAQRG